MKLPVVLASAAFVTAAAASPLGDYRWKNRLIVVSVPDGAARAEMVADFQKRRAALEDRDLIVIDASPTPLGVPGAVRPEDLEAVRKSWKLGGKAVFVLIGKDGGEKSRQTEKLDLEKFFALIDTMPMRKAEMREGGG